MGASPPRGLKRRPTRHEGKEAGSRSLINQQPKPLKRGGINPVQILDDEEHWLVFGDGQGQRQSVSSVRWRCCCEVNCRGG